MVQLLELSKLRRTLKAIAREERIDLIGDLKNFSDEAVMAYLDSLPLGEELTDFFLSYLIKYVITYDSDCVHDYLMKQYERKYASILYALDKEVNTIDKEMFFKKDHKITTLRDSIDFSPISGDKTRLTTTGMLAYKFPKAIQAKTFVKKSSYDSLVVDIEGKEYSFYRSSKKNTKIENPASVSCFSSYELTEQIQSDSNVRIMLPMVLTLPTKKLFYADADCYVLGKISKNRDLLLSSKSGFNQETSATRFLYNLDTKYRGIYVDTLNTNVGMEDIISLMAYTNNLYVVNKGYEEDFIFKSIEHYKDFLRVNTFIEGDFVKYDCSRVNIESLKKLEKIPENYMEKYIFRDIYVREKFEDMLKEIVDGKVKY